MASTEPHRRIVRVVTVVYNQWSFAVGGILALFHLMILLGVLIQPGRPPLRPDSAIFQYAGWYMTHGATLYTEIWEVKPPLAYEIPALLALLSGGSVLVHHLLNVTVTIIAAVASGLLVGLLIKGVTDDRGAAFVSAISVLLLPGYFYLPAYGFKAKFFVAFFALLSIYSAREEYPALSGAFAAACIGFYQAAVIIPAIAVGLSYQHQRLRGVTRTIAGGAIVTGVMIAPIVGAGAVEAMIVEAVLIPFIIDSGRIEVIHALIRGGLDFGIAAPAVLFGGIGLFISVYRYDWRETWWVIAAASWFAFVVFFLDYDNYPDLIPGLVILAIGIGISYDWIDSTRYRFLITGFICMCVTANLFLVLLVGGVAGEYPIKSARSLDELEYTTQETYKGEKFRVERPDIRYIYWKQIESETCHVRLSRTELRWLQLTEKPLIDRECGDLTRALKYI